MKFTVDRSGAVKPVAVLTPQRGVGAGSIACRLASKPASGRRQHQREAGSGRKTQADGAQRKENHQDRIATRQSGPACRGETCQAWKRKKPPSQGTQRIAQPRREVDGVVENSQPPANQSSPADL